MPGRLLGREDHRHGCGDGDGHHEDRHEGNHHGAAVVRSPCKNAAPHTGSLTHHEFRSTFRRSTALVKVTGCCPNLRPMLRFTVTLSTKPTTPVDTGVLTVTSASCAGSMR